MGAYIFWKKKKINWKEKSATPEWPSLSKRTRLLTLEIWIALQSSLPKNSLIIQSILSREKWPQRLFFCQFWYLYNIIPLQHYLQLILDIILWRWEKLCVRRWKQNLNTSEELLRKNIYSYRTKPTCISNESRATEVRRRLEKEMILYSMIHFENNSYENTSVSPIST